MHTVFCYELCNDLVTPVGSESSCLFSQGVGGWGEEIPRGWHGLLVWLSPLNSQFITKLESMWHQKWKSISEGYQLFCFCGTIMYMTGALWRDGELAQRNRTSFSWTNTECLTSVLLEVIYFEEIFRWLASQILCLNLGLIKGIL